MKQNYDFFYAYCYKGQLKLQGNDYFECENVVYKFSRKIGFSIDGMRWEVTQSTYQEDIDVHSNVSALLNRRMFHPQIGLDPAYRKMDSIILEEQNLNALIDWKEVSNSPIIWGICVFIFVAIILVCVIKKYLTRSRINEMQNWVSEMRFTQLLDR